MILYIHIPFCESKCGYCAFSSVVLKPNDLARLKKQYIDALILDISYSLRAYRQYLAQKSSKSHKDFFSIFSSVDSQMLDFGDFVYEGESSRVVLDSIYIGGGTPNTLNESDYERIFGVIFDNASLSKNAQITIEANPNLLNKHWCKSLRSFGVNRISMGVQSFDNKKLKFLERAHTSKDIFKALELASIFRDSSIDLIYGTPLDSKSLLKSEVAEAMRLPISHISAYCLMQENGAKNATKYAKLESKMKDSSPNLAQNQSKNPALESMKLDSRDFDFCGDDGLKSSQMGEIVRNELAKYNFCQYEASSFAKNIAGQISTKSAHNLSYWRGEEYLACGLLAVGRVGQCRYSGEDTLSSYIASPLSKQCEWLSVEDLAFERVFLGLRSEVGILLSIGLEKQILKALEAKSSRINPFLLKNNANNQQNLQCQKIIPNDKLEQDITNALENLINPKRIAILINEEKCDLKGQNLIASDYFLADEIALYITSH
ncbi:radical SAM family heme chaperone HemW [Helicobacter sp. T3_23-1059]